MTPPAHHRPLQKSPLSRRDYQSWGLALLSLPSELPRRAESCCSNALSSVTHEAIRQWCLKFGQNYANQLLKRRRAQPGDKWHLDEVFLTINGKRHYLWRAVDQDDNVLDILVQSRRNKQAAKKFFRKLLKGLQYVPRVDHYG